MKAATIDTFGRTAGRPQPCQVTPSRPRIAQLVGSARATSRTQPGSTNVGIHSPPSIDTPRITRMLTLRARASVPPTAATSSPVAADSRLIPSASSANPDAAAAFLDYVYSQESLDKWVGENRFFVPVEVDLAEVARVYLGQGGWSGAHLIAYGLLLIAVVLFLPQGAYPALRRLWLRPTPR